MAVRPPGDSPPPPPRHAAPTGHAGQGDNVGPPHPHTRAHSTWVADPNSPPSGRAVGGGTAPDLRRPSQWWKAPPPGDASPPLPQRATPARKSARCGAGAGSPRPHRPYPGHTSRGTLAARSRGRAAGGGTVPDTRHPSERWQANPPGDGPRTTPWHAAPAGHAGQRDSFGPQNPHTHAHSTWVVDPNSPRIGRAVGGGTAPDLRRPSHNGGRHPPPGTPFRHPHGEERQPARAHAVGPVLGPHARTDRTRDTRVAEPKLPAPEDGPPGEGQRLTPDAPCNGGRHPPRGRTNTPTHQPRDIRCPAPALRHSDTTMAEPAAPRKTRPRSPTLDAAHEVIRALGLRDGKREPPQGDAGTDSDLEAIPEPSTGSAPAEPAPPAGSVPTPCPAWKRGHCTSEG